MKLLIRSVALVCSVLFANVLYAQPSTFTPLQDAQVYSGSPTFIYNTAMDSMAYLKVVTGPQYYRFYVKFNITGIPSNAIITSAQLRLKPTSVGEGSAADNAFVLQTVSNSWAEGISFNTQPSTSTLNQVVSSFFVSPKRVFDVKLLVQSIVNSGTPNNGWQIRRNPETTITNDCQYKTKESLLLADKPELVINWYLPVSIAAATIVHTTAASPNSGSITPVLSGGTGPFTYQWTDNTGAVLTPTTLAITGLAAGWYGLRVTGANSDVCYMAFIVGTLCETTSLLFNPGPNFIDDATLNNLAANATTNYGTNVAVEASSVNSGGWLETTNLLRFRLWMDPALTPTVADLYLTGKSHDISGRTNDAILQQVTANWAEASVTYNTTPTSVTTINANVPPTVSSTENDTISLLNFWNYWRVNNTANFGMLFKLDTYAALTARQQYYSSDFGTSASRPYIKFILNDAACDKTSYVAFKRDQDAGYATTFQNKLKIQFTEEYKQVSGRKIQMILYDENKIIKAAINADGTALLSYPLLPALTYQFDDNRYQLNLSSYSLVLNKFYILELTTGTGEKAYIRFQYTN